MLRSRLTFLAKDSFLYGGAMACSKALALITLPILTRSLSVAEFGYLDLFLVIVSVVSILVVFGQDSAVARFYYEEETEESRKQLISQSFFYQITLSVIAVLLLYFLKSPIAHLLSLNAELTLLSLAILQVPFVTALNFSQNILKWTFQRRSFLLVSLGNTFAYAALLISAHFTELISIQTVLLIALSCQFFFGALGTYLIRKWIILPSDWNYLKKTTPYAVPLGVIAFISAFTPLIERQFVLSSIGEQSLGIYAGGYKIALLLSYLSIAFQTAWGPFSLSIYKEKDAHRTYDAVLKVFTVCICALSLFLAGVSDLLIEALASKKYLAASALIFPLSFGFALQAISWITETGISLSKKTHLNIYPYITFLIISWGLISATIDHFGIVSVAIALMIAHMAKASLATYLSQRVYPIRWSLKKVSMALLGTLIYGSIGITFRLGNHQHLASAYFLIGSALILAFGFLFVLTKNEKAKSKELFVSSLKLAHISK